MRIGTSQMAGEECLSRSVKCKTVIHDASRAVYLVRALAPYAKNPIAMTSAITSSEMDKWIISGSPAAGFGSK
jgi:hypothetical protein